MGFQQDNVINQGDLTLHSTTVDIYNLQTCMWDFFFRIDHMLGYETQINKFKRIVIIQSMLSGHNVIKLIINNRKITKKM